MVTKADARSSWIPRDVALLLTFSRWLTALIAFSVFLFCSNVLSRSHVQLGGPVQGEGGKLLARQIARERECGTITPLNHASARHGPLPMHRITVARLLFLGFYLLIHFLAQAWPVRLHFP